MSRYNVFVLLRILNKLIDIFLGEDNTFKSHRMLNKFCCSVTLNNITFLEHEIFSHCRNLLFKFVLWNDTKSEISTSYITTAKIIKV